MKYFAKHIKFSLIALLFTVLSGCGDDGNNNDISSSDKSPVGLKVALSKSLRALPTETGELRGYVMVDGIRHDMTTNTEGTEASASLSLAPANYDFDVRFEWIPNDGSSPIQLISSTTQTVNISTTSSNVNFTASNYNPPIDDDGDGLSNLDELSNGTDPLDTECIIGFSLLDQCTLG